jgi:hypothetical protein
LNLKSCKENYYLPYVASIPVLFAQASFSPHGVISQEIELFITTSVRTSNPTKKILSSSCRLYYRILRTNVFLLNRPERDFCLCGVSMTLWIFLRLRHLMILSYKQDAYKTWKVSLTFERTRKERRGQRIKKLQIIYFVLESYCTFYVCVCVCDYGRGMDL